MMEVSVEIGGKRFRVDLASAKSIAIDLEFDADQPQHFAADAATRRPMTADGFIGRTDSGGSCNVDILTINPHCNGTHTETVGHIVNDIVTIGSVALDALYPAVLLSVPAVSGSESGESYEPTMRPEDNIISRSALEQALHIQNAGPTTALIVRTLPNESSKKIAKYGESRVPPYFSKEAMELISELGVKHLLVDFPSIDRMHDEGKMTNHHLFWVVQPESKQLADNSRCENTITEMIFVDDDICDGLYLLNLQVAALSCDVSPSRPILYALSSQ